MIPVGINPESNLVEIIEIPSHKWFVGVQFHPEYSSTVINPHPLFVNFIKGMYRLMMKPAAFLFKILIHNNQDYSKQINLIHLE